MLLSIVPCFSPHVCDNGLDKIMATKLSTITDKSDIAADVFNCLLAGQMRPFNNLIVALEHKV